MAKSKRGGRTVKKGVKPAAPAKKKVSRSILPVVAIGASAGGLEAILQLLENLPPDTGAAYVILQHLSPSHESALPELLGRKTKMKVSQVTDGMKVQMDHVYVIPPNYYLALEDGQFSLAPRVKSDEGFRAIDHFLASLARVYQNWAIAVILSGTAADGTAGVKNIKAEGGITFAQDDTARFQGMPSNAI